VWSVERYSTVTDEGFIGGRAVQGEGYSTKQIVCHDASVAKGNGI